MIARLLEGLRSRVQMADASKKTDETLGIRLQDGEVVAAHTTEQEGCNLRVVVEGRSGHAGTTTPDTAALVEAAMASAEAGELAPIIMPSPSPLPRVQTHIPRAATATTTELVHAGRMLTDRLAHKGRTVAVHVERSVGSVQVGNTRGVDTEYQVTLVALDVEACQQTDDAFVSASAHLAGADLPTQQQIELIVSDLEARMRWAARPAQAPDASAPVLLLPEALRTFLAPLQQALVGKSVLLGTSPLADLLGEEALDPCITLVDDPLQDCQAGSRPIDDEGVASYRSTLIEKGFVRRMIYDLESGALAARPSTGHARRSTFGKPQAAFSNLMLQPGESALDALLKQMGDGLLVDAVAGGTGGSSRSGTFTHPVVLGYRVQGGEVTGRVEGVVISGNLFEVLRNVAGLGRDSRWIGSSSLPPLLLEGMSVTPR
jgi:PmbA protein